MNKTMYDILSGLVISLLWIPITLILTLNFMFWTFVQFPDKMFEMCEKLWNEQEEL